MPRDEVRWRHMLDAAREASDWIAGKSLEDFRSDRKLALACLHCLVIIGEAAVHLSPEARKALADQPLHQIIGMRNKVVHGYYQLDQVQIWDTLRNDLAPLIASLEQIIPPNA